MKIAISGTQCIGKSTFIQDFLKKWPMYKQSGADCSSIIKEKNLKHSKDSDESTQDIILDHLLNQAYSHSKKDHIIYDRCTLDNLVYTAWLHLKGRVSEEYLNKIVPVIQQSLKLYDIIFYIPITKVAPVEIVENGTRNVDPTFREEINNIFSVFISSYYKGDRKLFPSEECPAVIEIFGKPEERIKLAEFYVNEKGNMYGEEESLITIPPEFDPELIGIL